MSDTVYMPGYCDECGGTDCTSPWCQLSRMCWDLYLEPDAMLSDDNPFAVDGHWYFYDADSGRHGPFESERAAEEEACAWLDDVGPKRDFYAEVAAGNTEYEWHKTRRSP